MFLETIFKKLSIIDKEKELILKNIKNVVNNEIISKVGLIYGKVQSGKTRNLICLSAKLFDMDTKLIIFLFSDTKILLEQNFERFEEAYEDLTKKELVTLISSDDISILSNRSVLDYYKEKDKKIIICGLKNTTHLQRIIDLIKDTPYSKTKSVIIDDEGDDITQNTSKNKFNARGLEINRSAVNQKLIDLKNNINCGLISVTATPQAIVLLQSSQDLSPSWCEVLKTSPDYNGLDFFYDEDKILEVIPEESKKFIEKNGTPESFITALSYFIVSSTIIARNNPNFKAQMLIHPDKKVITHKNIHIKINENLTHYFKNTNYKNDVMNKLKKCFIEIKERNKENNSIKVGEFIDYSYEDFLKTINYISVNELNTRNKTVSNDIKRKIKVGLPFLIFVGGDLLDRGITFPNLLITYIFREAKKMQEDTMLQRARWLGYRKEIYNFSKVYLTQNLYDIYREIKVNTNHLTEMLEHFSKKKDLDLRNINFKIRINKIYNPTSKSKASWEPYNTEWYIQSIPSAKNNNENLNIFDKYINYTDRGVKEYMNSKFLIDLVEFKRIINKFSTEDPSINKLRYNLRDFNLVEDTKIDLLIMRSGNYEERSLNKDKTQINNLFQGQSSISKETYPGDRYLLEDKIMIQFHLVKLKEDLINNGKVIIVKNTEVPMIAVGIPYAYRENFITRKNLFNYS